MSSVGISLLFADDVILLASSDCDLEWFEVKCEVFRERVSTSKSEGMVLCQKTADCSLGVGS